jgi:hypothetical protein
MGIRRDRDTKNNHPSPFPTHCENRSRYTGSKAARQRQRQARRLK